MEEENLKKIESKLWASAEKMRGAVSVSDYKFIVLGLIFLKYISDSFEEKLYIFLCLQKLIKSSIVKYFFCIISSFLNYS